MSFIGYKLKAQMVKMGTSLITKGVFDYSLRAYHLCMRDAYL